MSLINSISLVTYQEAVSFNHLNQRYIKLKKSKEQPKFIQLKIEFLCHKDTTLQEKILLAEIYNLSKSKSYKCNASNGHFSKRFNIPKTSISRSISNLEKKGYINSQITPKTRNHERIITINNLLIPINNGLTRINKMLFDLLTNCQESKENIENNNIEVNNINVVFNYWKDILNHHKSKIDSKRKTKLTNALKSFSVDECKLAIDGCKKSSYHMGDNDRNTKYDSIDLIFRNNDKIEYFINLSKVQNYGNNNTRKLTRAEQSEERDQWYREKYAN